MKHTKKFVIPILCKMTICVKVTYRSVAPPCATQPMKQFINEKKIFFPNLLDPKVSSQYLNCKTNKYALLKKCQNSPILCRFHLQGRGGPPDPKYYNKF